MAQLQSHHPTSRPQNLIEGLNDPKKDKLTYLFDFLMSGLNTEGYCKMPKQDIMKLIGAKRMSKDAYEMVFTFMPKHKIKPEDIRILPLTNDIIFFDVNRLESFSTVLTASEDN